MNKKEKEIIKGRAHMAYFKAMKESLKDKTSVKYKEAKSAYLEILVLMMSLCPDNSNEKSFLGGQR